MTTEPERKKPWDKEPITKCEWAANRAAIQTVIDEDAAEMRLMIKKKLMKLAGKEWDPRWCNINMVKAMVKHGYLVKPAWHERSTLVLDHFLLEELSDAYSKVKAALKPVEVLVDPDNCPF